MKISHPIKLIYVIRGANEELPEGDRSGIEKYPPGGYVSPEIKYRGIDCESHGGFVISMVPGSNIDDKSSNRGFVRLTKHNSKAIYCLDFSMYIVLFSSSVYKLKWFMI